MGERLLASHILAKVVPPALLVYLLFGSSGTTTFSSENGEVTECSASIDYAALVLAAVGVAATLFLLRLALKPRSSREEEGALGNRIGAGVTAVLTALLILKGLTADGPTDLTTCIGE